MEEAVAREVGEEAGVRVRPQDVHYAMSQPWPLSPINPQLMLGCVATVAPHPDTGSLPPASATDGEADGQGMDTSVAFDRNELEHAAWFPRAAVRAALSACESPGAASTVANASTHSVAHGADAADTAVLSSVPPPAAVAHHLLRRAVGLPDL